MTWMVIHDEEASDVPSIQKPYRERPYASHPRTESSVGKMSDYEVEYDEGMVVLDVIQNTSRTSLIWACRWNCKAGKCGSCSAEVNGIPFDVHD